MSRSSTISIAITFLLPFLIDLAVASPPLHRNAPPLPSPSGTVVTVSTESALQAAVNSITSGTTKGVEIRYNLMDAGVQQRDGATGTVSNNVTNAQPGWFVNAEAGDLHLVAIATAAIDKAAARPSVPTDYDAETRPQGTVPDIGADEFSLGSQPPEAPTNVRVLP